MKELSNEQTRGLVVLLENALTKKLGILRNRNKEGQLLSLDGMEASPVLGTLRLQKEWSGSKRAVRVVDIKIPELNNKIKEGVPVGCIISYCPITSAFLSGPPNIIEMGKATI